MRFCIVDMAEVGKEWRGKRLRFNEVGLTSSGKCLSGGRPDVISSFRKSMSMKRCDKCTEESNGDALVKMKVKVKVLVRGRFKMWL